MVKLRHGIASPRNEDLMRGGKTSTLQPGLKTQQWTREKWKNRRNLKGTTIPIIWGVGELPTTNSGPRWGTGKTPRSVGAPDTSSELHLTVYLFGGACFAHLG